MFSSLYRAFAIYMFSDLVCVDALRPCQQFIIHVGTIWAATYDFQQCGILTSVDSDQHVQPPLKFRNFKWCLVSNLVFIECTSDQQRLWSDCAYAQAGLSLCLSHIPRCWKSHGAAHLLSGLDQSIFSAEDIFCLAQVHTTLPLVSLEPATPPNIKSLVLVIRWKKDSKYLVCPIAPYTKSQSIIF